MADTPSRTIQELQAIPFGQMIGAPLKAVVEAQAVAAQTTVDFIEQVGLQKNEGGDKSARTVNFSYESIDPDNNSPTKRRLEVPLLTIAPVPYIRIENCDINFTAKITETIAESVESTFDTSASTSGSFRGFLGRTKIGFKAAMSYNRHSTTQSNLDKSYTIDVKVHAVQDDMPAGLARVLSMLEAGIAPKATTSEEQRPQPVQ